MRRWLQQHASQPILVMYAADGTPAKVSRRWSVTAEGGIHVVRHGKHPVDFCIQKIFLLSRGRDGLSMFARPCIPVDLTTRNTADTNFGLARATYPFARSCGANDVVVNLYLFDQKFFDSLSKDLEKAVELQYDPEQLTYAPDGMPNEYYRLLDWSVGIPCFIHAWTNALCYAVDAYSYKGISKDLFAGIESMRSGIGVLIQQLPLWVMAKARFVERPVPEDIQRLTWIALGETPAWADTLAFLGLLWDGTALLVDEQRQHDDGIFGLLSAALTHVMSYKKFNDARFLTNVDACRGLWATMYLGVDRLAFNCLDSKVGSTYYLGGARHLDEANLRKYVMVTSFCGASAQAVAAMLLEDDRAIRTGRW